MSDAYAASYLDSYGDGQAADFEGFSSKIPARGGFLIPGYTLEGSR